MPKHLEFKAPSEAERRQLEKLRSSRTAPQRQVERAKIVLGFLEGHKVQALAEEVGRSEATVYNQLHFFMERGIDFLTDRQRPGRPETYTEQVRGKIVSIAKTHPEQLDRVHGHWTLDSLKHYLDEQLPHRISRSQIGKILVSEGIKWYQEKTYFSESPDPQFVEKRGR